MLNHMNSMEMFNIINNEYLNLINHFNINENNVESRCEIKRNDDETLTEVFVDNKLQLTMEKENIEIYGGVNSRLVFKQTILKSVTRHYLEEEK